MWSTNLILKTQKKKKKKERQESKNSFKEEDPNQLKKTLKLKQQLLL